VEETQGKLIDRVGRKKHRPAPPAGGFPRFGYAREIPVSLRDGAVLNVNNLSDRLPYHLQDAGFQFMSVELAHTRGADPFVIYNPWGEIVAEWEVMPSWGELLTISRGI